MTAERRSLVGAAAREVLHSPARVLGGALVLGVVPVTAAVCWSLLVSATFLFHPAYVDALSYDLHRTLTGLATPVALAAALAVFGVLDALYVAAIAGDRLRTAFGRVRANPWGVALWTGAFVVAFWPLRWLVLPQWTLRWTVEVLSVADEGLGWLPLRAVAAALALVAVLSAATFFLAPLAVVDSSSPGRALRENLELLTAVPVETAVAVCAGVGAVVSGVFVLCLGVLLVGVSLGVWVFGLVLLPVGVLTLLVGVVSLAAAYAFARTLLMKTYRRGQHQVTTGDEGRPAPVSGELS